MRLGLLNAYSPDNEATRSTSCLESFQDFFSVSSGIEFVEYRVTESELPGALNEDAYILSGSSFGAYEELEWIATYGRFLKRLLASGKKIVAICFGHQLLAQTLGGEVKPASVGWLLGPHKLEFEQTLGFMKPELTKGTFTFSNQDQIKDLPDQATLVAGSSDCPNGMYVVGDQVLAMQFHPEFSRSVMLERVQKFTYSDDQQWLDNVASRTENAKLDNEVIREWIVNFLAE